MLPTNHNPEPQTVAPQEVSAPIETTPSPTPDIWKSFQAWVWKRFGLLGLIFLACLAIWWQWDHVRKLPGVEPLVSLVSENALPKATPGKFNIALAHLAGDDEKHETERLIMESLDDFRRAAPKSLDVLSFDRSITLDKGDREAAEREGHERARTLLKRSKADVLVWGVVIKQGGRSVPKLY